MTAADLRTLAAAMTRPPYRYNASTGRIEGRGINEFLPKDICEMFVGDLSGNAPGMLALLQHHDALITLLEASERRRAAVCWSTGGQGEPPPRRTDAALTAVHAVTAP